MSRHRSRHHDRERERSRSPQSRYTSETLQASNMGGSDDGGREKHKRRERVRGEKEREREYKEERGSREEKEEKRREEGQGRREEREERREERQKERHGWREEGERREKRQKEERQGWKEEEERKEERWRGREGRERRQREEGERREKRVDVGNMGEERRREEGDREGERHGEEVGRGRRLGEVEEREDGRQGERGERRERRQRELSHEDMPTTKKDEERRKKREQRMAEDDEAKNYKFGGEAGQSGDGDKEGKEETKDEPNFGLSGKLTAETNTYKGVVIKYSEPAEARQPTTRWRLYQFKGEDVLPTLYVHRQSAYLIGRDRRVVDVPVDHPSCSSQHAVLQYRLVNYEKKDGSTGKRVRPYLIDLESTNGTFINNQKIEPARYWELKEKDMIKFGFSSREYILLHENSEDVNDVS